jgi:hypothetical protein
MRTKNNYLPEIERARAGARDEGRLLAGRVDPPRGLADGRTAGLRARARARPPALSPLGDRSRKRSNLPASGVDSGRSRHPLDGPAGDGSPAARPSRAEDLRRVSPAAPRDQLLRDRLPHAARAVGRVPRAAKADRNIAVEDYRDAFGVTHEAAALRFTNLATSHLDMNVHFLRVGDDGAVAKAYENDGLRLPVDVTGSTEGQLVCHYWAARQAFDRTNRTTEFYQYTDTPEGTFWESCQTGTGPDDEFSITIGVPVRRTPSGSEVARRPTARCRAARMCRAASRRPTSSPNGGRARRGRAPSCTRTSCRRCRAAHSPGVDDQELYAFLDAHAE